MMTFPPGLEVGTELFFAEAMAGHLNRRGRLQMGGQPGPEFTDANTGRHACLPLNVYTSKGWLGKSAGESGGRYGLRRHSHTLSRVGGSRITPKPEGIPSGALA